MAQINIPDKDALLMARKEIVLQTIENEKLVAELIISRKELAYQNDNTIE